MSLLLAAHGCQRPFFEIWLILEVAETATGAPVVGATVSVPTILLQADLDIPVGASSQSLMAPTDALGRTWIPAVLVENPLPARAFTAAITHDGDTESLPLTTDVGSTARGTRFTARIVEVAAGPPPANTPRVVFGTSPTEIVVEAYIARLWVVSSECRDPIFALSAQSFRPRYLGTLVLNQEPPGFLGGPSQGRCAAPASPEPLRYWVSVKYDDSQPVLVDSDFYCLDDAATTIPCR